MRFGIRQAIAVGIVALGAAAFSVLWHYGVDKEILGAAAAAILPIALWVGLGGKCCGRRCKGSDAAVTWLGF